MALSRRRVLAVTRRQFVVLRRSLPKWFELTVWPLLDVVLWGALGTFVASDNEASRASAPYLLAGIVLFHVVFQTQLAVANGFLEETWSRNLLNVLVTPVREIEYVAGLALFTLAKMAMGLAVVSVAAWAFYGFDVSTLGWSLLPIFVILMLFGWALSQLAIGLILRFGPSAEVILYGLVFMSLAVSGVFNPVEALPIGLEPLGRILPTTAAFGAMRDVIDGKATPWGELGVAIAGAVVLAALSQLYVVRMLKVFRDRGFVTRFS